MSFRAGESPQMPHFSTWHAYLSVFLSRSDPRGYSMLLSIYLTAPLLGRGCVSGLSTFEAVASCMVFCWDVVLMLSRCQTFRSSQCSAYLSRLQPLQSFGNLVHIGMSSCRPSGPVWKHKRWPYWQSESA